MRAAEGKARRRDQAGLWTDFYRLHGDGGLGQGKGLARRPDRPLRQLLHASGLHLSSLRRGDFRRTEGLPQKGRRRAAVPALGKRPANDQFRGAAVSAPAAGGGLFAGGDHAGEEGGGLGAPSGGHQPVHSALHLRNGRDAGGARGGARRLA